MLMKLTMMIHSGCSVKKTECSTFVSWEVIWEGGYSDRQRRSLIMKMRLQLRHGSVQVFLSSQQFSSH